MKIDYNKIISDTDLFFLKKHDFVLNLSKSFAKILKNYKPTLESKHDRLAYSSIRGGIILNIENIDQLHDYIDTLHSALNEIKHSLFGIDNRPKKIKIKNDKNVIENGKEQLVQLLNNLKEYSSIILREIDSIEALNPKLLCLLFHTDEWGGTLFSTYSLRPEHKEIVNDRKKFFDFSIDRVLGLSTNKIEYLIEHEIGEVDCDLYESLDSEEYYERKERPKGCYDKINYCIYESILNNLCIIIKNLRDSCRRIINEIDVVKQDEKFNDSCFIMILKKCFESFNSDGFVIYDKRVKNDFITTLRLLYDYKKSVEEHGDLEKINSEDEFHNHLENYLTKVRKGGKLETTHEGKKSRGFVDFKINKSICIELKISKTGYSSMHNFAENRINQLQEYMIDRNCKVGFLLGLDLSKQKNPHASKENYFKPLILNGGRSIIPSQDFIPIGVVSILIFGGKRAVPSSL